MEYGRHHVCFVSCFSLSLSLSFSSYRLCGRMPFNAETAPQLEEQILTGTLKFREPEWISISDGGERERGRVEDMY